MIRAVFSTFCILFCIPVFLCAAMAKEHGIEGVVLKHMDAPGYTYLLIQTESHKQWAAIPITPIQTGDKVTLAPGLPMQNFHSQTFNKTFDTIFFSEGLVSATHPSDNEIPPPQTDNADFAAAVAKEQQEAPLPKQANPQGQRIQSPGSQGAIAPFVDISVPTAKDANAVTVAELFQRAKKLQGTRVRIHARVVKFNGQILNRNWVHIQDGTGDPMHNTHDLVLTTNEDLQVGATILVEGTVAVDKDFGHGYIYPVLLEDVIIIARQ